MYRGTITLASVRRVKDGAEDYRQVYPTQTWVSSARLWTLDTPGSVRVG